MDVVMYAKTQGRGLWSSVKRETKIDKLVVESAHGEIDCAVYIKAKLDSKTWNVRRDGLVYTDKKWLSDFQRGLTELGMSPATARKVSYTEQGMQGTNYVSLAFYRLTHKEALSLLEFFESKKKLELW